MTLAQRLPLNRALSAADLWAGDDYEVFRRGAQECVRANFGARNTNDANELRGALGQWAGSRGAKFASVSVKGTLVTLDSCDAGKSAKAPAPKVEPLILPVVRGQFALGMHQAGATDALARCASAVIADTTDPMLFTDEDLAAKVDFYAKGREAARICGPLG